MKTVTCSAFLAASLVLALELVPARASACSAPLAPPPDGTIAGLTPALDSTSRPLSIPRDGAIVFQIQAGEMSDDDLRAKAQITVEGPDNAPIPGALSRSGGVRMGGFSVWVWRPVGELPVGTLHVTSGVVLQGELPNSWDVTVEDRLLSVPTLSIQVTATRTVVQGDDAAPKITCTGGPFEGVGSCGPRDGTAMQVPIRAVVRPVLDYKTDDVSLNPERRLFRTTVRLYSKDAAGTIAHEEVRADHVSPGGSATLARGEAHQYCASVTVTSLMNESVEQTTESCVPNTLDLTISEAEEEAFVAKQLEGCAGAVYPEGSSPESPTGRPRALVGDGGCSMSRSGNEQTGAGLLLAAAIGVIARGRARRARIERG